MVIDDEEALRAATSAVLEELGYEALSAPDGQSAIDLLEERGPVDAVILDMTMPGLSSADTFLGLREVQADLPVLLTTGYAHNDEAQRIIELGVDAFIEKPWSIEQLSEALRAMLAGR
jgi:CheY-like chemotaxis protein